MRWQAKVNALREWWSSAVLSLSKDRASDLHARIETQSASGNASRVAPVHWAEST